ncbi:tryptophan--tRNA ligase [Microbacterium sp. Au-Mic1]|uniref:tryptophan--tRNA ligase n=1 Tax=Microbacterium sp. Au-Mic1 TaxID=2906457 RepID=UPI001E399C09|nr:tryptophan--tRNA ligase [Microbacterium sp. Au-Mic1]MCE4025044.1 tryptophan--tRNA ligase [Microbacterium sp. Au-Mic1]
MDTFTATTDRMGRLRSEIAEHPARHRILTGERPTGRLHLGHLFGTILERARLQAAGVETFVVLADYQVITDRESPGAVRENILEAVRDNLAAGLDPERTVFFTHSSIPELNQLMLPFLSLVTDAELRRNPTVKAEAQDSGRALGGLLLTYPVHQAADILFCKGTLVPVGKDNLPHVEMTRTIARRFNERYARIFPVPAGLVTDAPELPGLDGRKMSKSHGNGIALGMSADETATAIRRARTDADRLITYDPVRRPGVSGLLTTAATCLGIGPADVAARVGTGGSAELKRVTIEAVNDFLRGHREGRARITPEDAAAAIRAGNARARGIAAETLDEVRAAMGMAYGF